MTYKYDIFLSYRHAAPVGEWVSQYFYPLLKQWLPEIIPRDSKIFIDKDGIETGSNWSARLSQALQSSRCLVAILSPSYFRSEWCLAEWHSMRERERLWNFKTVEQPGGLIYSIVFSDGKHFPPEAKATQQKDLKKWNSSARAFSETQAYIELEQEVQKISEELWLMIQSAPEWHPDFPIVQPVANPTITMKLPRF
ncbi:MAG: hypothetical protein C4288_16640 [Leptolyngbya sp. ERB_1_1]